VARSARDAFYTRYYAAVATSRANAAYCQRLYGLNLCQHGFAEVAHLDQMIGICSLNPQNRLLDLGCGNGLIAEYISDRSGAHVTGIDFIPEAIQQIIHLLKPGSQICAFYSHGPDPSAPNDSFSEDSRPADKTPLGIALQRQGLSIHTWDYSRDDYEHALLKFAIAEELKSEFEKEANLFLYENHIAEAKGVAAAFEKGLHARYLYFAKGSQ